MELHLRCLYTHDATGRITTSREPEGHRAARFHLARTRLGNLWRLRDDLSAQDVRSLARLAGKEMPLDTADLASPPTAPERLEPFRRVLRAQQPIGFEWAGPAYHFPETLYRDESALHERTVATLRVSSVEPGEESVLARHFAEEIPSLASRQPFFAALEEGCAVAICQSARPMGGASSGLQPCVATEAGVATVASHRGRGLAARVVAAWAAEVVRVGGCPLYSTSWENLASRAVARKLGLVCYGEDVHLR